MGVLMGLFSNTVLFSIQLYMWYPGTSESQVMVQSMESIHANIKLLKFCQTTNMDIAVNKAKFILAT